MTTPLIKTIARALAKAERYAFDEEGDSHYMSLGQAALTAITEAGYAVVPLTATEEMLEVGAHCASTVPIPHTAERIYRTMIQAAQGDGA